MYFIVRNFHGKKISQFYGVFFCKIDFSNCEIKIVIKHFSPVKIEKRRDLKEFLESIKNYQSPIRIPRK